MYDLLDVRKGKNNVLNKTFEVFYICLRPLLTTTPAFHTIHVKYLKWVLITFLFIIKDDVLKAEQYSVN